MQHVYTARDGLDANFLRGLLEQEGLRAVVQGEALQETWGSLNLTQESLPSVWVDDGDVARAQPIVDEYRRRDAVNADLPDADSGGTTSGESRPTWACQNCGRRIEEQFTTCWHCGHERKMGSTGAIA
jgi:hypothetical protein